jgi:PPP family 3-phenylpropionic acid transporter
MPLIDSTVLRLLGGRRDLYGRQRVWGTIGYAAGVLCVGVLTQRAGLRAVVHGFLPLMLASLLLSLRLPMAGYRRRIPFWRGVRTLITNRRWAIFLTAIFIAGLGRSAGRRLLLIHLSDLGMPRSLMGLGMAVGALGEVPLFFYSSVVLRRWSTRTLLVFSWLVSIARLFTLSVTRPPWLFLPLQLAQGVAFSATFSAGVNLTSEMAPEGMGATAQVAYGAMRGGLASAAGAFLGGLVYDQWGGHALPL